MKEIKLLPKSEGVWGLCLVRNPHELSLFRMLMLAGLMFSLIVVISFQGNVIKYQSHFISELPPAFIFSIFKRCLRKPESALKHRREMGEKLKSLTKVLFMGSLFWTITAASKRNKNENKTKQKTPTN